MKPITREEMYLAAAAGYDVTPPEPVTRKEMFLAKLAGMEVETPAVFTRQERFLDEAAARAPSVTINNQDITVTENGQYTADEGYTGLGTVTVEVPDEPAVLEDLEVTENGNYTPSDGVDGFGYVSVNVPDVPAVVQPLEVTENGTYTAPDGVDGYSPVTVNVPAPEIVLQDKTITENGTYTADSGYDGLGSVTVDVAGSGGLPAGGYWKPEKSHRPTSYSSYMFMYGGRRYMYALSTYDDKKYDIYSLEDDVYTLVATDVSSNAMTYGGTVEYNGELHLFGGNDYHTYHYVWTGGSTITESTKVPYPMGGDNAFVMDNSLYVLTQSNGFYKWNADNETWEHIDVTNISAVTYPYNGIAVIGRKVYILGNGKLFEVDWDNKVCTAIRTDLPSAAIGRRCTIALNGKLYFMMSTSYSKALGGVYKYDLANNTYELVASTHANIELYLYDNRIYGTEKGHFHQALYEVTE